MRNSTNGSSSSNKGQNSTIAQGVASLAASLSLLGNNNSNKAINATLESKPFFKGGNFSNFTKSGEGMKDEAFSNKTTRAGLQNDSKTTNRKKLKNGTGKAPNSFYKKKNLTKDANETISNGYCMGSSSFCNTPNGTAGSTGSYTTHSTKTTHDTQLGVADIDLAETLRNSSYYVSKRNRKMVDADEVVNSIGIMHWARRKSDMVSWDDGKDEGKRAAIVVGGFSNDKEVTRPDLLQAFVNVSNENIASQFKVDFLVDKPNDGNERELVFGYRITLREVKDPKFDTGSFGHIVQSTNEIFLGSRAEALPQDALSKKAAYRDIQLRYVEDSDRDLYNSMEFYYLHEASHLAGLSHPFEQREAPEEYLRDSTVMAYRGANNIYPVVKFGHADCHAYDKIFGSSRQPGNSTHKNIADLEVGQAKAYCVPTGSEVYIRVKESDCSFWSWKKCNLQKGSSLNVKTGRLDKSKYATIQNVWGGIEGMITTNGKIVGFMDEKGNEIKEVRNDPNSIFMTNDRIGGKMANSALAIVPLGAITAIAIALVKKYMKKRKGRVNFADAEGAENRGFEDVQLGQVNVSIENGLVSEHMVYDAGDDGGLNAVIQDLEQEREVENIALKDIISKTEDVHVESAKGGLSQDDLKKSASQKESDMAEKDLGSKPDEENLNFTKKEADRVTKKRLSRYEQKKLYKVKNASKENSFGFENEGFGLL